MRSRTVCFVVLTAAALVCPAMGQNLLLNPGFDEPAIGARATVTISGNVADGDTIVIDTTGVNRTYEFDTDATVGSGNVAVDVSAAQDKAAAKTALIAAINDDASALWTASDPGGDNTYVIWDATAGYGATNADPVDANSSITVGNFTDTCRHMITDPVPGWSNKTGSAWSFRNGDQWTGACPSAAGDHAYFSVQGTGGVFAPGDYAYQTVSGVTAGKSYTFSGEYFAGQNSHTFAGNLTIRFEVYDGSSPTGTLLNYKEVIQVKNTNSGGWVPFSVAATPTQAAATVAIRWINGGTQQWAVHVNDCSLAETTCANPPTLSETAPISPTYAAQGSTVNMTISGTNFVAGSTSVKLKKEALEIAADPGSVVVAGDGKSLTCSFNLTGAAQGRWSVEVTVTGNNCLPVTASGALNVVMPAFTNGSFEDPTAAGGCPVTPIPFPSRPTGWLVAEAAGYGWDTALFRDSDRFPPTCPPPDGLHYASSTTEAGGGASPYGRVYQTFLVQANQQYTLTGFFAGGGNNTVTISLLDGDDNAATLGGATTIHTPGGPYDWTFSVVTGTPTTDLMTVEWKVTPGGDPPHAAHADKLQVMLCQNPITVTGATPSRGANNGTLSITDLAGTGFSSAAGAPQILLSRVGGGSLLNATNVVVASDTRITCDVDLTAAPSGYYDVIVVQDGCVGTLSNGVLVLGESLENGDFELPAAALTCGQLASTSSGWNFNDDKWRDHVIAQPTCPRLVPDETPHGHYQSMTTGADRDLRDQRAWQSLKVIPGRVYKFAGYFAGGGENKVKIRLLDGGPDGTEIKTTMVYDCAATCGTYDWTYAQVVGASHSDAMTVVWELTNATSDGSTTHADGMTFESICASPSVDFDGDADVDQADFAFLQICFDDPIPAGCECADIVSDGVMNVSDVNAFEDCASGPGVPADPGCGL